MVVFPRMRTLYFDCFSGISGDMTIGACWISAWISDYLRTELQKLPLNGYRIDVVACRSREHQRDEVRCGYRGRYADMHIMNTPTHHPHAPAIIERHRRFCR